MLSALAIAMLGASGRLRGDLDYVHGTAVESQERLRAKRKELERFQDLVVGRELKMMKLKNEAGKLKTELEKLKAERVQER